MSHKFGAEVLSEVSVRVTYQGTSDENHAIGKTFSHLNGALRSRSRPYRWENGIIHVPVQDGNELLYKEEARKFIARLREHLLDHELLVCHQCGCVMTVQLDGRARCEGCRHTTKWLY